MHQLPLDVPDLMTDLAPYRTYLTADERRVLATCTGTLLLATALIPGGAIGDLAVRVLPEDPPATQRWATVVRASTVVLFSWRLLREISRRDSVLPWVTISKNCGCGRAEWCSHFRDATVEVIDHDADRDRIVIYDLVHGLPIGSDGHVLSDAIAGRLRH
jgi:hypothetical protein